MNDDLQRTDEWYKQRAGKFTASQISVLLKSGRKKEDLFSQSAISYIKTKLAEKLADLPQEFDTIPMKWGKDHEQDAIDLYQQRTGNKVKEVGFIEYDDYSGGSPDGLVGSDGIIEVKCPYNTMYHIETLINGTIKPEYIAQIQWNMFITNRKWCDFISFDPRMKNDKHKIKIIRVDLDIDFCLELKSRLNHAISELIRLEESLK